MRTWLRRWGLPAVLPLAPGERVLWHGAPAWKGVARRVYRIPVVVAYFAGLTLLNMAINRLAEGGGWPVVRGGAPTALMGVGCVLILAALAWTVRRTTRYTLTTRRMILQYGVALPATLVIPLHRIASSAVRVHADHTGDVALGLFPGERLGVPYFKLWPHARPWQMRAPQPMLRGVPQAAMLAPLLTQALTACADAKRAAEAHASPPQPATAVPAQARATIAYAE